MPEVECVFCQARWKVEKVKPVSTCPECNRLGNHGEVKKARKGERKEPTQNKDVCFFCRKSTGTLIPSKSGKTMVHKKCSVGYAISAMEAFKASMERKEHISRKRMLGTRVRKGEITRRRLNY